MKRKYALMFLLCVFPGVLFAQEISEISLTAISDAYAGVRRYCAKTKSTELANLNDYIIQNNGALSTHDLVQNCQYFLHQQDDSCDSNNLIIDKSIPANVQCQAYIGTAIDAHNKLVDKLTAPGTYVQPYNGTGILGNNNGVYSIIGVVPGNSNDVYNISPTGQVTKLPFQTRTPDMFINIDTNDNLVGVHNRSVIYSAVDMTKAVSDMIEQSTGGNLLYTLNSSGLSSQGDTDIKDSIGVELYQTPEQKADSTYGASWAHTNGVLFEGRIVNFEWLGHYIFGARKGTDAKAIVGLYDLMADNEQATTSGLVGGQAQKDSVIHKGVAEQARIIYSNEQNTGNLRQNFIESAYVNVFANMQTNTEPDAYRQAAEYVKSILGNVSYVKCWGVCDSVGDDTVTCTWGTNAGENGITHFTFDDICNGTQNYTTLPTVQQFARVQTRTEYDATTQAEQYIRNNNNQISDLICDGDCDLMGQDKVVCFFKQNGVQYKQEFTFDDICN
ncbi:MAG: hypothetical protein IJD52_00075 [Alphaproteobacteria bacterium]|nr:hypothetical protein [Alphaproteobacteria bacterium]